MKVKIIITLLFMMIYIFPFKVSAADIFEILPKETYEILEYENLDQTSESLLSAFSLQNVLIFLIDSLKNQIPLVFSGFKKLLLICVIMSLLEQFCLKNTGEQYLYALRSVGNSLLIFIIFESFSKINTMVQEALESIRVFCDASIPVVSALSISSGKSFQGALFSYGISISSAVISALNASVCLPLIQIFLSLGCCGTIWDDVQLSVFTDMIKKAIKYLIGIVFSVFTLTMSLQTVLATASDNIAIKSLKTAASSMPFLGNVLSQSIDSTFTLLAGTKTAVGVLGIISILVLFFPTGIYLALQTILLQGIRGICGLFGVQNGQSVLKSVVGAYELLQSLFLISVLMSIICFLMICIGVA